MPGTGTQPAIICQHKTQSKDLHPLCFAHPSLSSISLRPAGSTYERHGSRSTTWLVVHRSDRQVAETSRFHPLTRRNIRFTLYTVSRCASMSDPDQLGEPIRTASGPTPEEERAARLIQRTYRGYADRTRVKGMKLYVTSAEPQSVL